MDNFDLVVIRLKAFGLELVGVGLTSVLAWFMSPAFQAMVTTHFGDSTVGVLLLLLVTGGVKHLRNKRELAKLGGEGKVYLV